MKLNWNAGQCKHFTLCRLMLFFCRQGPQRSSIAGGVYKGAVFNTLMLTIDHMMDNG